MDSDKWVLIKSLCLSLLFPLRLFFFLCRWVFFSLCVLMFADPHRRTKNGSLFFTIATSDFPRLQKLIAQWNWFGFWRDFFSFFFSFFFRFFWFLLLEKIEDRRSLCLQSRSTAARVCCARGEEGRKGLAATPSGKDPECGPSALEYLPTYIDEYVGPYLLRKRPLSKDHPLTRCIDWSRYLLAFKINSLQFSSHKGLPHCNGGISQQGIPACKVITKVKPKWKDFMGIRTPWGRVQARFL